MLFLVMKDGLFVWCVSGVSTFVRAALLPPPYVFGATAHLTTRRHGALPVFPQSSNVADLVSFAVTTSHN